MQWMGLLIAIWDFLESDAVFFRGGCCCDVEVEHEAMQPLPTDAVWRVGCTWQPY